MIALQSGDWRGVRMLEPIRLFLAFHLLACRSQAHENVDFANEVLSTSMPKPLSDFTASADRTTQWVYLAGGCDSPLGNVYQTDIREFVCGSISSSLFEYRREDATTPFRQLPDMPVPRYRHAAVLVNRQLWLLGGRDLADNIVSQVDVYDIASSQWSTFYDLPEQYWLSDLVGFRYENEAYFGTGYNYTYVSKRDLFAIDTVESMASGGENTNKTLVWTPKASLLLDRGDASGLAYANDSFALVASGFSSGNGFCAPLKSVERYDFAKDQWAAGPDLVISRSDNAMVVLHGHFLVLGGETQVEYLCEMNDTAVPGEQTIPVNDLELYDPDDSVWNVLKDLPYHRFRWTAVAFDDTSSIYTFGGQVAFNQSCQCFATTDEIVVYQEEFMNSTGTAGQSSSASERSGLSWFILLSLVLLGWSL